MARLKWLTYLFVVHSLRSGVVLKVYGLYVLLVVLLTLLEVVLPIRVMLLGLLPFISLALYTEDRQLAGGYAYLLFQITSLEIHSLKVAGVYLLLLISYLLGRWSVGPQLEVSMAWPPLLIGQTLAFGLFCLVHQLERLGLKLLVLGLLNGLASYISVSLYGVPVLGPLLLGLALLGLAGLLWIQFRNEHRSWT